MVAPNRAMQPLWREMNVPCDNAPSESDVDELREVGVLKATYEKMYEGKPPWEIGRPQPEIVRLAQTGDIRGTVLDVGCGTGENAIHLASRGCDVLGVDIVAVAVERARAKARGRGVKASFEVLDALDPARLNRTFDAVIDSGLFHGFSDEQRVRFAASLAAVIKPGGKYYLLCFCEQETREGGPRRVTQDEIRAHFVDNWCVETVVEASFSADEKFMGGARAWLATIRRL